MDNITSEQFRGLRDVLNVHSVLRKAGITKAGAVYHRVFFRNGNLTVEESRAIARALARAGLKYKGEQE